MVSQAMLIKEDVFFTVRVVKQAMKIDFIYAVERFRIIFFFSF